ncbi:MAG: isochorismate synthase [Myxococcota bacterium]|jgi:isochorismate synthase|nr:isochorismate synthase [Myxococcota bacterium]
MSDSTKLGADVRAMAERCVTAARETATTRYATASFDIRDEDLLNRFVASDDSDAFYWEEPEKGFALLGLGRVAEVVAGGRDRFADAALDARELFARTHGMKAPSLVGGFAFYEGEVEAESEWSGLGSGRLLLPALSFVRSAEGLRATACCAVEPGDTTEQCLDALARQHARAAERVAALRSMDLDGEFADAPGPEIRVRADRPHRRYTSQVEFALDAIEAGKVEKLVLARSLQVHSDRDFDRRHFFDALRTTYPTCALAIVRQGDDTFVSATPERLVRLTGDRVETVAVAGSAARGRNPDEEARLSRDLLGSAKEREEHEVVKRAIRGALADVCGEIAGPSEPSLLKLEGIQHLETPLVGALSGDDPAAMHVLDLVGRLHPTPAVAGAPRGASVDWLERFERLDRGWYAGPVGYVDAEGRGEFRVALRSARLGARDARLFAGAGIVPGSDPERELAETRLKLRALLAPLTEI